LKKHTYTNFDGSIKTIYEPSEKDLEKRGDTMDLFGVPNAEIQKQTIQILNPKTALARNTDPETSHKAAEKVKHSMRRQSIASKVYECLKESDGLNFHEIAKLTGLKDEQVWRRLSDLKNEGFIEQRGERDGCGIWKVKW